MERTLILCKPDAVQKNQIGEVLNRFEKAGLQIVAIKMTSLSAAILTEHYSHLKDRPFFPEILGFMQSSPVVAVILEGPSAISRVRELLGPTDSRKAPSGTLRGDLGTDSMRNVAHASDSPENAAAEIKRFFLPTEILR